MVSFEKALFDTNEALHHMGFIPLDKSITLTSIALSFVVMALLAPFMGRLLAYLFDKDRELKYTSWIMIGILMLIILVAGDLLMFIATLLFMGCIYIIYSYDQYSKIREYLDRIF